MLSKKSKIIVLSAMLALLVVTGYLNVYLNNRSKSDSAAQANTADFFTTYRSDRTATTILATSCIPTSTTSTRATATT